MIDISDIQNFASRNGHFNLLDWILDRNWLDYSDYERWRYGQLKTLDDSIQLATQELQQLCSALQTYCEQLKLVSESKPFYLWGADKQQPLVPSCDTSISQSIQLVWRSPQDVPQMDLFMDNTATILENQVTEALVDRRFPEARNALEQLATLNQAHPRLGAMTDLINYGDHIVNQPVIDVESLSDELEGLSREVAPLAGDVLGSRQRDYLAFAWRRVAESFLPHQLKGQQAEQCCYALEQIPDWPALQKFVEARSELYQSPLLMKSLANAYAYTRQSALYVLMWGILFERLPEGAEEQLHTAGKTVTDMWEQFTEKAEDSPDTHFLGFLFIQQPGLTQQLNSLPQCGDGVVGEPANRAILELVKARVQEQDERSVRAAAKETAPELFRIYLNKRDWQASLRH